MTLPSLSCNMEIVARVVRAIPEALEKHLTSTDVMDRSEMDSIFRPTDAAVVKNPMGMASTGAAYLGDGF